MPQRGGDNAGLNPDTVLPPDVLAEAEEVQPQKGDTSPSIWSKISSKVLKSREPEISEQIDEAPADPTNGVFSFDSKTLEDAERIAKGHPPNDP